MQLWLVFHAWLYELPKPIRRDFSWPWIGKFLIVYGVWHSSPRNVVKGHERVYRSIHWVPTLTYLPCCALTCHCRFGIDSVFFFFWLRLKSQKSHTLWSFVFECYELYWTHQKLEGYATLELWRKQCYLSMLCQWTYLPPVVPVRDLPATYLPPLRFYLCADSSQLICSSN